MVSIILIEVSFTLYEEEHLRLCFLTSYIVENISLEEKGGLFSSDRISTLLAVIYLLKFGHQTSIFYKKKLQNKQTLRNKTKSAHFDFFSCISQSKTHFENSSLKNKIKCVKVFQKKSIFVFMFLKSTWCNTNILDQKLCGKFRFRTRLVH